MKLTIFYTILNLDKEDSVMQMYMKLNKNTIKTLYTPIHMPFLGNEKFGFF